MAAVVVSFDIVARQEIRMDENRIEGTARTLVGTLESAAGKVTGDTKLQADGAVDKLAGRAQRGYGDAADAVRDTVGQARDTVQGLKSQAADYGSQVMDQVEEYGDLLAEKVDERPLTAVLMAVGIGFLLALATKPAPRVIYRRR